MDLTLAQVAAGWPLAASLAAVAVREFRLGRRRSSLNEALHELRRPLQALALAAPVTAGGESSRVESSLQLAAVALARLEREVNGEAAAAVHAALPAEPLLQSVVERWRERAGERGSLELSWRAGRATVVGDHCELAQALDNLVVNAIEHGGPEIAIAAHRHARRLAIVIADSGSAAAASPARPRRTPVLLDRLRGRSRRGHGLRLVRRTAIAHGGQFQLRRSERGTEAVLELPLAPVEGV